MKSLFDYILEECGPGGCGPGPATPANTMGMGSPMMPDGDTPGSEPLPTSKTPKKKRKKKFIQ